MDEMKIDSENSANLSFCSPIQCSLCHLYYHQQCQKQYEKFLQQQEKNQHDNKQNKNRHIKNTKSNKKNNNNINNGKFYCDDCINITPFPYWTCWISLVSYSYTKTVTMIKCKHFTNNNNSNNNNNNNNSNNNYIKN